MQPSLLDKLPVTRIRALIVEADSLSQEIAAAREQVKPTISDADLKIIIEKYERVSVALSIARSWSDARYSISQKDETAAALESETSAAVTTLAERTLYLTIALKTWPSQRLQSAGKALPRYKQFFHELVLAKAHSLTEPEERVLLISEEHGGEALGTIYDLLTNSFRFNFKFEGKELTLTRSELSQYYSHKDHAVRKAAQDALAQPFLQHKDTLGELYRAVAGGYRAGSTKLRKFEKPIDARHYGNMIPHEAYDALLRVCNRNRGIFQRYVERKAQILKLEKFTRYDFMAPVPGIPENISYEDAMKRVLAAFDGFAPWFGDGAREIIAAGHLDAFPRDGKRPGACCYPIAPGETPIVLTNFQGTWDDVSTLAHELGHAVHDIQTNDLSVLTSHPPLVLAESASTFGEYLLFLETLKHSTNEQAIALLCARLDDMLLTIVNQIRITRFEVEAQTLLEAHAPTSELDALWARLAKEDFPNIEWPESMALWRASPHIHHSPFYCYSYAFGILLVCALVRRRAEPGFSDRVKALLSAGGNAMPADLLKAQGIDLTQEKVWEDGFATINELVLELENRLKAYK